MEGPSLAILKEAVRGFRHKKVLKASGYADIDLKQLKNKTIKDFKVWGKHFLVIFPQFTLRIHFLLFGTYYINERKNSNPKLSLYFNNGALHCYICSVKIIEEPLKDIYDWDLDLLSKTWSFRKVKKLVLAQPNEMACDVILDPDIFAGAGNIIKNEALHRAGVHPESTISKIPEKMLNKLIRAVHSYTHDFFTQTKEGTLSKHWQVYAQKRCRTCGGTIQKKYDGKKKRRSFICKNCMEKF